MRTNTTPEIAIKTVDHNWREISELTTLIESVKGTGISRLQILKLVTELTQNLFVIENDAHELTKKLSSHLRKEFPKINIELVLIGSNATGGALLRREIAGHFDELEYTDLDYAVLIDQKSITNQNLPQIEHDIYSKTREFVERHGLSLCQTYNPSRMCFETINTVEEAEKIIFKYLTYSESVIGLLYFFPTYPFKNWAKNIQLINQALENLRISSPHKYAIVEQNIKKLLKGRIKFKSSQLSPNITEEQYRLARIYARMLSNIVGRIRVERVMGERSFIIR